MSRLRPHEQLAIDMLLDGDHRVLETLRRQANQVAVSRRTYTTAGEYIDLIVPEEVEIVEPSDLILQDIEFEFKNVNDGAAILLYVERGRLSFLEFATYGCEWPEDPEVLGVHYLREHQTGPGSYVFEPVPIRDPSTLERALIGRLPHSDA